MMIRNLALLAAPLLNVRFVRRVRRNHGLEHATIHLLSRKLKNLNMAGRSTANGYYLYGNVGTAEIEQAAHEALSRMRAGEHGLAIHPNCGTGLVTAGLLTSVATLAGTTGMKRGVLERLARLPSVILLSTLALIAAQPLGLSLQHYFTTLGDPGDLQIVSIRRYEFTVPIAGQRMTVHFVKTAAG
ncbi:MAG: DUF6391 domain-containing protein [Chloroflexota bacterium]|jgi:hypothetical protein|nr:DUF6391 domain-containing protein [Anaerolineae bacterium]